MIAVQKSMPKFGAYVVGGRWVVVEEKPVFGRSAHGKRIYLAKEAQQSSANGINEPLKTAPSR